LLFERYHVLLYNFYTKLTGGPGAERGPLCRKCFCGFLRHRQTFKQGTPFSRVDLPDSRGMRGSIIFGRAGRRYRSNRRWRRRWRQGIPAQQQQESEMLHRALMELPEEEKARAVGAFAASRNFRTRKWRDWWVCGVPTVKVRIHRALQELRQAFHQLQAAPANSAQRNARQKISTRGGWDMKCEEIAELLPDYLQEGLGLERKKIVERQPGELRGVRRSGRSVEEACADSGRAAERCGRGSDSKQMLQAYQTGRGDEGVTPACARTRGRLFGACFQWLRLAGGCRCVEHRAGSTGGRTWDLQLGSVKIEFAGFGGAAHGGSPTCGRWLRSPCCNSNRLASGWRA